MKKNLKKRLKIIMSIALLNIVFLCIALYQLHTLDKKQQDIATVAPTHTPAVSAAPVSPVMTTTPAPSQTPEIVTIDTSSDNSLQRIVNSSAPLNKEYIPENLVQKLVHFASNYPPFRRYFHCCLGAKKNKTSLYSWSFMVGATRLELATSTTPR